MNLVESYATFIFIEGGRFRSSSGNSARTPFTSVSGLPCGVACTPMKIACSPLNATLASVLWAASSTVAISSMRTKPPSFDFTIMRLN